MEPCPGQGGFSVGLDRLSLSFPVRSFEKDPKAWSTIQVSAPGKDGEVRKYGTTERVGGASVFLGVAELPNGVVRGKVEVNPARVLDPEGWGFMAPSRAGVAMEAVSEVVHEYMAPIADLGEWRTKRLDVARDFEGVVHAGEMIRSLGPLPRPWARRNLTHADPSRHGAQTLMVGSGAGVVRLYDKFAETAGKCPEGTVRWEAEARSAWLEKYGQIKVFSDLTDENVRRLANDRWEWSAMGHEVGSMSRVYEVVRVAPISDREKQGLLAFLWAQAAGDLAFAGKSQLAKYRRLQRQLGVVLELDDAGHGGIVSRLDWESGREVFRAA